MRRNDEREGCCHSIKSMMLITVVMLQIASFVASSLLTAANIWMLIEITPNVSNVTEVMSVILRFYNMMMCALIVLSLFDFEWMIHYTYFLMTYIGNGLFQIFVGVMTLGAQDIYAMATRKVEDETGVNWQTIDDARTITGWIMVSVGISYIVLGFLQFPYLSRRTEIIKSTKTHGPNQV